MRAPAGPAVAPLQPLLWYLIHSCSLPDVIYSFMFDLIWSIPTNLLLYYIYHWWWVVVGGGVVVVVGDGGFGSLTMGDHARQQRPIPARRFLALIQNRVL